MKTVDKIKAGELRNRFIAEYVDTSTQYYKEIEKIVPDISVDSQWRYSLFDTLKNGKRRFVGYNDLLSYLSELDEDVYIMWDIMYDQEGEYGEIDADICLFRKYGYTSETMLLMNAEEAAALIRADNANTASYMDRRLPEDIYIFDEAMSFYFAITHCSRTDEWNNETRTCFSNMEV